MFALFRKKHTIAASGLMKGLVDFHAHLLPCVDDGVKSDSEAIAILEWYEQMGVSRVVMTPHVMENYPLNSAERLRGEFERFKRVYDGGVELSLGAEYMMDQSLERAFERGELLTLRDDYLLVESSFSVAPMNFFERIASIMSRGYFVVLAHPERFLYLSRGEYDRLKGMGVLFQLNLGSLLGVYGGEVRSRAEWLLCRGGREGAYDLIGSDIHSFKRHHEFLTSIKVSSKVIDSLERVKSSEFSKGF